MRKMELERPNPADHMLLFKKKLWITEYSTRMQRMLRGERLPPLRIDAEPHRRCTFRCLHCSRSLSDYAEEPHENEIPEERWYELARESGEMGVKAWNIAGICEPMLKPDMVLKLMGFIKQYGMFGELTTNGYFWKEEHIQQTIDMGWDCISVSIDGPDKATHEALRRVPSSFRRACRTVKRFADLRRRLKTHKPTITINQVLTRHNYNLLPEMVKLASQLGADVLFVEPMVVYSEDQRNHVVVTREQRRDLKEAVDEALKLAEKKNLYAFISCLDGDDEEKEFNPELAEKGGAMRDTIQKGTCQQVQRYREGKTGEGNRDLVSQVMGIPCYYPWFYLMVTAEGNAVHCGECTEFAGNIRESSLEDLWWGQRLQRYRELHMRGELPASCDKCRPNVIGDMKLVRKSIFEYGNLGDVQKKLAAMTEHALNLKHSLYYSQRRLGLGLFKRSGGAAGKKILDV